jgi:hypothetical protein
VAAVARSDKPKKGEDVWWTEDARGARVTLFDSPAVNRVAAHRLELTSDEYGRFRKESLDEKHVGRRAAVLLFAFIGLRALMDVVSPSRGGWSLLDAGVAVFFLLAFVTSFRISSFGYDPERFAAAMLRRARCPRCAYRLEGCAKDATDGSTVCPECGAAWKLDEITLPRPESGMPLQSDRAAG